jgi:hypothetical protein
MVKQTDDSVSSLTSVRCLINEVVDPAWYPFTTNPKDGTLPCCLEYIGPGWRGVLQMMDQGKEDGRLCLTEMRDQQRQVW